MLRLEHIRKSFGNTTVLKDISLEIEDGDCVYTGAVRVRQDNPC